MIHRLYDAYRCRIALLFILIFHSVNSVLRLDLNQWPIGKDWYIHLTNVIRTVNKFDANVSLKEFIFIDQWYPPFYYWIALVNMRIFGAVLNPYKALFLTPLFFFIILICSVFLIGRKIMDEETGVIAAAICSFFPINYVFSCQFNLELATAAMISMSIYFLLTADRFKSTYYSALLGIVLAVGMLTRIFIPLFIAAPVIFTLFGKKSCVGKVRIKQFQNIMITLCIAGLIALIYYHQAGDFVLALRKTTEAGHVTERNLFSLNHIFFYLKRLFEQAGVLSTLFFVLSLGIVVRRMDHLKGVIVWWFAASFLILTIIPLKQPEFAVFYMPPIAIIIALVLTNIKNEFLGKYCVLLLVVVQMCGYFYNY